MTVHHQASPSPWPPNHDCWCYTVMLLYELWPKCRGVANLVYDWHCQSLVWDNDQTRRWSAVPGPCQACESVLRPPPPQSDTNTLPRSRPTSGKCTPAWQHICNNTSTLRHSHTPSNTMWQIPTHQHYLECIMHITYFPSRESNISSAHSHSSGDGPVISCPMHFCPFVRLGMSEWRVDVALPCNYIVSK